MTVPPCYLSGYLSDSNGRPKDQIPSHKTKTILTGTVSIACYRLILNPMLSSIKCASILPYNNYVMVSPDCR